MLGNVQLHYIMDGGVLADKTKTASMVVGHTPSEEITEIVDKLFLGRTCTIGQCAAVKKHHHFYMDSQDVVAPGNSARPPSIVHPKGSPR